MEYDPAAQCEPGENNSPGCIIAELEQLRNDLRCAPDAEGKKDALRYAVHFVGDIHQPLHTVREEAGGNGIEVVVYMRGQTCPGRCRPEPILTNLHFAWDSTLINKTVWAWGSYVSRLEEGWLKSPEARGVDGGTPLQWALETHKVAQAVWNLTPDNKVLDDAYYRLELAGRFHGAEAPRISATSALTGCRRLPPIAQPSCRRSLPCSPATTERPPRAASCLANTRTASPGAKRP